MIHTTIGVYNNGERKVNGVPTEHLVAHIAYNLRLRPGRAFFVDGICVNAGYLGYERCKALEPELAGVKRETVSKVYT